MDVTFSNPPGVAAPVARYSQVAAVAVPGGGTMLFLSGQVPLDADGALVGAGDFEAQAEQVLANVDGIVSSFGGDRRSIVKLTVYFTDIATQRPVFGPLRDRFLPDGHAPASTAVEVSALASPEWLLEVEAVAVVAGSTG